MPDPSMSRSGSSRPTWYRPAVYLEWQRPWWGFKRMEKWMPELDLLPVRAVYLGPVVVTWLKGAKS